MESHLQQWVRKQGGAENAARLLGITPASVRVWLRRESSPRPKILLKLIKISKGELNLTKVLSSTLPLTKK